MRSYNPAIVSYMNMNIDDVKTEEEKPKSTGLLAPRSKPSESAASKDDITQPYNRIAKHMRILRNKRNEINGV